MPTRKQKKYILLTIHMVSANLNSKSCSWSREIIFKNRGQENQESERYEKWNVCFLISNQEFYNKNNSSSSGDNDIQIYIFQYI